MNDSPKLPNLPNKLREDLRVQIDADENGCVAALLEQSRATQAARRRIQERAARWVERCRRQSGQHNLLDAFLGEFSLSNPEGIALMCLAEALLRIPDADTADALINEKISSGRWRDHFQQSDSSLVNAATLGLIVTGGFTSLDDRFTANPLSWLEALSKRLGEPVVRLAIKRAMGLMGKQYVLGRTIDEAAKIGRQNTRAGTRFSFDMLGEGARTHADAETYFNAYLDAIQAIGKEYPQGAANVVDADGISVKLSALHPRYHYSHLTAVEQEMLPRLKQLAAAARGFNIGFTIDAEESERLDISLTLFEALVRDPDLQDWDGLGMVVQAYQKRAPLVLQWLEALARESGRTLMVRLVKGAYWDREIKFAQEMGYQDYPVYTRKENTDLSYRVCTEILLDASDVLYPQFATHNAMTIAAVLEAVGDRDIEFEFQRLHGMGELLYDEVLSGDGAPAVPLRVYAPVGAHKDLLPYLVRRLLENGANSSFVNQFLDKDVPVIDLVGDPVQEVTDNSPYRHPKIPLPLMLYRESGLDDSERDNSRGMDLGNPGTVAALYTELNRFDEHDWQAGPLVAGKLSSGDSQDPVRSPADHKRTLGTCAQAGQADIDQALQSAATAHPQWDGCGGAQRAEILEKAADLLEEHRSKFLYLIVTEGGRTLPDAVSEIREAVDFCRYYALQARQLFDTAAELPGPTGERNQLSLHGRGVFVCISPWNFPLAIFVGQVAAALAAGNSVIAKPAEQTPLIAFEAVRLLHKAGVPANVLHLITGAGSTVGPLLVNDQRVSGVCFTGSTEVAKLINRQLAERPGPIVPLIAETGGQNAMIVDSSALPEQVTDDVIGSAFNSAGQRCSALRVLFLQEEVADDVVDMLAGAVDALELGDPRLLSTDVGPVIDAEALAGLEQHLELIQQADYARVIKQFDPARVPTSGSFFAPVMIELDSITRLQQEVFGPVLHIIRYRSDQLAEILQMINGTGFGLTLGVHSRREGFADQIFSATRVGNTYINRNMVGAVVGVQPFGGQGLSGTGPKAGGPHYLLRFATEKTRTTNLVATGGNVSLLNLG